MRWLSSSMHNCIECAATRRTKIIIESNKQNECNFLFDFLTQDPVVGFVVMCFFVSSSFAVVRFIFNTQPFWNDCRFITASYTNDEAHVYLVCFDSVHVFLFFSFFASVSFARLRHTFFFPKWVCFCRPYTIKIVYDSELVCSLACVCVFVLERETHFPIQHNSCKHCAQPFQRASFTARFLFCFILVLRVFSSRILSLCRSLSRFPNQPIHT